MCWRDRIEQHPEVLVGKPVIKGTRISVHFVLERMGDGWSMDDLLTGYPHIERDDVLACLQFASEAVAAEHAQRLSA